jgi:hypothetical protein
MLQAHFSQTSFRAVAALRGFRAPRVTTCVKTGDGQPHSEWVPTAQEAFLNSFKIFLEIEMSIEDQEKLPAATRFPDQNQDDLEVVSSAISDPKVREAFEAMQKAMAERMDRKFKEMAAGLAKFDLNGDGKVTAQERLGGKTRAWFTDGMIGSHGADVTLVSIKVVGKTVREAKAIAKDAGVDLRVVKEDGVEIPTEPGYQWDRLNVVIKNGKVDYVSFNS